MSNEIKAHTQLHAADWINFMHFAQIVDWPNTKWQSFLRYSNVRVHHIFSSGFIRLSCFNFYNSNKKKKQCKTIIYRDIRCSNARLPYAPCWKILNENILIVTFTISLMFRFEIIFNGSVQIAICDVSLPNVDWNQIYWNNVLLLKKEKQ